MADPLDPTDTVRDTSRRRVSLNRPGRDDVPAILVKVLFLGVVIGTAIALTPAMVGEESWFFLVVIWVVTLVLVATYATGRALPAKYLVPGTLMLALFVVFPIALTAKTSFTNYGDGTRNDKQTTVDQIVGSSVTRADGLAAVQPHHRHRRRPDLRAVHLLPGPPGRSRDRLRGHRRRAGGRPRRGHRRERPGQRGRRLHGARHQADQRGLRPARRDRGPDRERHLHRPRRHQRGLRGGAHARLRRGRRHDHRQRERHRLHGAAEGRPRVLRRRRPASGSPTSRGPPTSAPTTTRRSSPTAASAAASSGSSSGRSSSRPCRSSARSCSGCSSPSRSTTRGCAASKIYRALLILPYAIPGFISLLLWSSFYNQDFGLINDLTGLNINWFGGSHDREDRGPADEPLDGLPLHVPRRAPVPCRRSPRTSPRPPGSTGRAGSPASAGSPSRCCW